MGSAASARVALACAKARHGCMSPLSVFPRMEWVEPFFGSPFQTLPTDMGSGKRKDAVVVKVSGTASYVRTEMVRHKGGDGLGSS